MTITIKKLENDMVNKLVQYLEKNLSENALLLYDLKNLYPEVVDFDIAIENRKIVGVRLIWKGVRDFPSVHLRADKEKGARTLLENHQIAKNIRFVVPADFSHILTEIYHIPGDPLYLMRIEKGKESLMLHHNPTSLVQKHRKYIENLFENTTDTDLGMIEWVLNALGKETFFGMFLADQLVSIAGTLFKYDSIAMIGNVYTKKDFRKQGLATYTMSALIKHLFYDEDFNEVQLYAVRNSAAYHFYRRLGFREFQEYHRFLVRNGETK